MKHEYTPRGVCSRKIELSLSDDGVIESVRFTGGCMGNTTGVARLVIGMKAQDAIAKLRGIDCGGRKTSCPDQLSIALERALSAKA